jgi:hypothetical protein
MPGCDSGATAGVADAPIDMCVVASTIPWTIHAPSVVYGGSSVAGPPVKERWKPRAIRSQTGTEQHDRAEGWCAMTGLRRVQTVARPLEAVRPGPRRCTRFAAGVSGPALAEDSMQPWVAREAGARYDKRQASTPS